MNSVEAVGCMYIQIFVCVYFFDVNLIHSLSNPYVLKCTYFFCTVFTDFIYYHIIINT